MPRLSLDELGWSELYAAAVTDADRALGLRPARIGSVYSAHVEVWRPAEEPQLLTLRGRALRDAPEGGIAIGDFALAGESVERILPRKSVFMRQAAGERSEPQAIAANIDRVLVVSSVDADFNERRLERYLVAIAGSGAEALVVLTKADLSEQAAALHAQTTAHAPTILTSARTGEGIAELRAAIPRGTTVALVGSSGVGKSALVNALLGETTQQEGAVRAHDKRGRHTTTKRSLFVVPGGGLLVDTPGMRELKPWQTTAEDADAFADVAALATQCRFTDCRHQNEPGCAIREAIAAGTMTAERFASWEKLEKENAKRAERQGAFAALQEKRRGKVKKRRS